MKNLQALVGMGLLGIVVNLTPQAMTAVYAQGGLIREGDLREADQVRPGSWEHVDELASDLEKLAQGLHDQVHLHLEGHAYFRHMDGHAEEIEELAEHIHGLAHKGQSIKHLREDVIELDEQVHHASDVITKIARHGVVAVHYDGGVRQTRRLVNSMNAILHHLEEDLTELDPDYRHETLRPGLDHGSSFRRPSEEYHHRYPNRGYHRSFNPHGDHHH